MTLDYNIGHAFMHPWFWSSFLSWILAQTIKMTTNAFKTHTFDFEYLVSTGGMPSAHSAMASGMAFSIGFTEGFGTPVAMLGIGWAAVTIFDAATVRKAAGDQAKVLNQIVKEFKENLKFNSGHLKELLGHTQKEVWAGMLTGILVALAVCSLWRY
ncbi:MAG: divergent PAP2 family protein [Kiritimatiellae bacterium]|nr:divergent PAP2 family protein [Kiritimatiellia bacterium]